MSGAPPTIAVVIPTLNEAAVLAETLAVTRALGFHECLVVDGGSTDGTMDLVRALGRRPDGGAGCPLRLVASPAGRACQMNAGADATDADVLLFLHADTRLPDDARQAIADALADPRCVAGRFDVQFNRRTILSRIIAELMNHRSRWTGMMTGDQAIFVRAWAFRRLGGYAPIPLMEDVDLSRRLKPLGTIAALRTRVTTSYRRWERHGPLRTIVRMWTLRFLYWLGVDPHTLVRFYQPVR